METLISSSNLLQAVTAGLFSRPVSPYLHLHAAPAHATSRAPQASMIEEIDVFGGEDGGPAFSGVVFGIKERGRTEFVRAGPPRLLEQFVDMLPFSNKAKTIPPVRFFTNSSDADAYMERLNMQNIMVEDVDVEDAYEYCKENPSEFQIVPSEKQVKAANVLLKKNKQRSGVKLDGVPVFTAQKLCFADVSEDGIKWYKPYFFDKEELDNVLETSVDLYFKSLISFRDEKRRSVDSMAAESRDPFGWLSQQPMLYQNKQDRLACSSMVLRGTSKSAELQLLHAVDRVILGNRWLRKLIGVQGEFQYVVDSFEARIAACTVVGSDDPEHQLVAPNLNSDDHAQSEYLKQQKELSLLQPQQHSVNLQRNPQKGLVDHGFLAVTMINSSGGFAICDGCLTKCREEALGPLNEAKQPLFIATLIEYDSLTDDDEDTKLDS